MSGGAGMKKLFLLTMLGEIGMKKVRLTQNVRWGWVFYNENIRRGWYEKSF